MLVAQNRRENLHLKSKAHPGATELIQGGYELAMQIRGPAAPSPPCLLLLRLRVGTGGQRQAQGQLALWRWPPSSPPAQTQPPGAGPPRQPSPLMVAGGCSSLLNRVLQQAPCCSPLAQRSHCAAPRPPPPTHQPSPLRDRGAGWRRRRTVGWGRDGAEVTVAALVVWCME
jgi:hypothetical protein